MALPFIMTIAGTIPLLLCVLLWLIQGKHFEITLGIRLLKFSLFFYLIPIQLLYYILPNSVYYFFKFHKESNNYPSDILRIYFDHQLIISAGEWYFWIPTWIFPLFLIWFICILIFAIIEIKKYKRQIKLISSSETFNAQIDGHCILISSNSNGPYSIGFRKTYIIMPEKIFHSEYREVLYRHELCHIQNHDIWLKLLCLLVICLHFYNPFAYMLLFMYNTLCEYRCDAFAVNHLSESERKEYARLLVKISAGAIPLPVVWRNGFAGSKFNIKRRILYIMSKKSGKISVKILSVILSVFTFMACASTIWAYTPPQTTNWTPQQFIGSSENEYIEFLSPEFLKESPYYYEEENIDFSASDIVLKSESGAYIPLQDKDTAPKATCIHTFRLQYLYEHIKKSNGSCSVNKYAINICSKCNHIRKRTLESTLTYPVCPHN